MGLFSAVSGQKVASATVRFHSRSKVTVTVEHGRGLSYERRRPVETEAPVVIEYSTAAVLFCFYYAKMLFTLASEEALTAQMVEVVTAAVESVDTMEDS